MDTLDHMSPSLDNVFHMATHLVEHWPFWGRWGATSTFDGGRPTTWQFHIFWRMMSLMMTWLSYRDTLAPMGYDLTPWWWDVAPLHDDLTPFDGTLCLYMMWHLLMRCHNFWGMIWHLVMKCCNPQCFTFGGATFDVWVSRRWILHLWWYFFSWTHLLHYGVIVGGLSDIHFLYHGYFMSCWLIPRVCER